MYWHHSIVRKDVARQWLSYTRQYASLNRARRRCPSVAQLHAAIGITKSCEKTLLVSGSATRGNRHNIVIGWNEHVEPFRKKYLLWHSIWLDNSKPKSGLVADIMHRQHSTRCQYYSQVKRVIQNIRFIRSQKMAKSMVEGVLIYCHTYYQAHHTM